MITTKSHAATCPRESEARRRTMSTIATIQALVATIPSSQSQSIFQPYAFVGAPRPLWRHAPCPRRGSTTWGRQSSGLDRAARPRLARRSSGVERRAAFSLAHRFPQAADHRPGYHPVEENEADRGAVGFSCATGGDDEGVGHNSRRDVVDESRRADRRGGARQPALWDERGSDLD